MNKELLKMILPSIVGLITKVINEENKQKYGSKLFNLLEEFVKDTETEVDDIIFLPILKAARGALGIK